MADGADGDAGSEVEVFLACFVPNTSTFAALQDEREAPIGRDDVLFK